MKMHGDVILFDTVHDYKVFYCLLQEWNAWPEYPDVALEIYLTEGVISVRILDQELITILKLAL